MTCNWPTLRHVCVSYIGAVWKKDGNCSHMLTLTWECRTKSKRLKKKRRKTVMMVCFLKFCDLSFNLWLKKRISRQNAIHNDASAFFTSSQTNIHLSLTRYASVAHIFLKQNTHLKQHVIAMRLRFQEYLSCLRNGKLMLLLKIWLFCSLPLQMKDLTELAFVLLLNLLCDVEISVNS